MVAGSASVASALMAIVRHRHHSSFIKSIVGRITSQQHDTIVVPAWSDLRALIWIEC
jgi:hypothetical protein